MKPYIKYSFIPVIFFIVASRGVCQTVIRPPSDHWVFLRLGLEPELVTTIGYLHFIRNLGNKTDYYVGASLKFAPLIISNEAFRINLINAIDWRMSKNWKTKFSTSLYIAHNKNRAGIMNGFGFELRAAPMHYGNTWAKGFEIGWQYTALTHIQHSVEAKDTFEDRYPPGITGIEGPKNGWYRATASRLRLGFVGFINMNDNCRLQIAIGSLISTQKQGILLGFSHAQFPFYLETGFLYQW